MEFSITLVIIIITCLASIPAFRDHSLKEKLLFWPYKMQHERQYYRFLTGGTVHADGMHLIFNMVSLYSFGVSLEKFHYPSLFGGQSTLLYILLYLGGLVFSVIPDYFRYKDTPGYRALGASGAVSAVIFAAIAIEPTTSIYLFLIPIPIPGYLFGVIFLALSAYLAKRSADNIGHNAHFWGSVYGLLFTIIAAWALAHVNLVSRFIQMVF
jgi:membrane associated rhomboid family serine protease